MDISKVYGLGSLATPDFTWCNHQYAIPQAPIFSDCMNAFNELPTGDDTLAYFTKSIPPGVQGAQALPQEYINGK